MIYKHLSIFLYFHNYLLMVLCGVNCLFVLHVLAFLHRSLCTCCEVCTVTKIFINNDRHDALGNPESLGCGYV